MSLQSENVRLFLRDESGAITVDYVVLAAACCAVGLWSTDLIEVGMRALAGTVDSELRGESPDSLTTTTYDNGFDNGSQGWTGATTANISGIGNVLGPIESTGGLPGVNRDFAIDEDTERATFSFDLIGVDDLDGDTGTVFVDGTAVGSVTVNNRTGTQTFTAADDLEERGIVIRFTEVDTRVDLGGRAGSPDSLSSIEVTVRNDPTNPRGNVNIGFGSDASAGAGNEFFAIDNFTATTTARPQTTGAGASADTPTG